MQLYLALQATGHNVHLLITQQGLHGIIISGPEGNRYRNDAHAFLRHYQLPHIPAYADKSTHPNFVSTAKNISLQRNRASSLSAE